MPKNPLTNWEAVRAEETRLLRAISPEEGARQFFALMAEFEFLLEQTGPQFRVERNQAMIELQARLASLNAGQNRE